MLILDDLTIPNAISAQLSAKLPRCSEMVNQVAGWCVSVQLVAIVMPGECGHIFFHVIIRLDSGGL